MNSSGLIDITDREFDQLRKLIHQKTGIALADHKRALVCSRLGKRLRRLGLSSYQEYYDLLIHGGGSGHQDEMVEMINAITTNKTHFFREVDHFKFLANDYFPRLRAERMKTSDRRIRLWSAASSTGEEA